MKHTIVDLRKVMQREGIDAWISPSSDAHQSEYPTAVLQEVRVHSL